MHIQPEKLQPNRPSDMQIQRLMMGGGRYPVLVIDNFYRDPEHVRDAALALHYLAPTGKHPGYLAMLSLDMAPILTLLHACGADFYFPTLEGLLRRAHPWAFHRCEPAGSRPPRPRSTAPHTDDVLLAGLVYLNLPGQCRGGTGFYRHAQTATEAVIQKNVIARRNEHAMGDDDIVEKMKGLGAFEPFLRWQHERGGDSYNSYCDSIFRTPGEQDNFINASAGGWELAHVLEMKFNRLVLYPGFLLHAAQYRPEWFGEAPHECRLTQNFFLRWPDKAAALD